MNSIKAIHKSPECFFFFILSLLLFWGGCTAGYTTIKPDRKTYERIANDTFKGEIIYLFNNSGSHVICINNQKTTPLSPHPAIDFFIFDIAADSIVFTQNSTNAKIKWLTQTEAEVEIIPEIINDESQTDYNSFIFNVTTKKKVLIKDYKY